MICGCLLYTLNTEWVLLKLRECEYVRTDVFGVVVEICRYAYVWQKIKIKMNSPFCFPEYIDIWPIIFVFFLFGFITFTLHPLQLHFLQNFDWSHLNTNSNIRAFHLMLLFTRRLFRTCRRACYNFATFPFVYSIDWSKCLEFYVLNCWIKANVCVCVREWFVFLCVLFEMGDEWRVNYTGVFFVSFSFWFCFMCRWRYATLSDSITQLNHKLHASHHSKVKCIFLPRNCIRIVYSTIFFLSIFICIIHHFKYHI